MKLVIFPFIGLVALLFLVQRQQKIPENTTTAFSPIRDIRWGDINFLHTTDTHGWYSGHLNQKQYNANWGDFVSFSIQMKKKAHENNQDLLLIDTGDKHDGNGLGDVTVPNGAKSLPIFTKQDYDLITIGNHELYEWENSESEYDFVVQRYKDAYISTNVEILVNGSFHSFGTKYRYFETPINQYKILSFGFLFDFNRNNDKTKVTPISEVLQQDWFLDILKSHPSPSVDYIVVIGHIPITHEWTELDLLHKVLRKHYPETVIQYFGGHSHIRDFVVYDENSTSLESGRFCETVGWLSIDRTRSGLNQFFRSYLDFNLDSFKHHLNSSELSTKKGNDIKDLIVKTREELNLNEYLGHVSSNYYMDYVPITHPHSIFKLLTDKVLPSLEVNGAEERAIIINTGSVRYDLYKGNFTIDTKYSISPFKNDWVKLNLPKSIALQVSKQLNRKTYINLLPTSQFSYMTRNNPSTLKLSKGYVTHDDFGTDGDDNIHKPTINFPVPNVVEAVQINDRKETNIDLVFYNFLAKNVLQVVKDLTGSDYSGEVQFYSRKYLGELLGEYVQQNSV
ncbi:hypothetical protein CANTEDRAFT_113586 [Yamadazyma tenuis ATCC 10573]|uniref:Calcineurin-like phosphoesterase domain-containing protein n=1 Tax=Candida tenuis (strain ATCC 10573 / BCRC 21748 / CBS 615 / JCM 9827 / NBRC 10315 / NRRL Y-1498 / VKM Y-70) TaxID=590646 RepID=G3B0V9_CANTC|nr:uncharacterized protein CANTEDRAFT_113586 [Yamadazyma tenuis ATCC 10573]EGV64818.1 hypothetical protein CANTEDRAFT_113586 [Yamadazyma tenuis ATCC 10573]